MSLEANTRLDMDNNEVFGEDPPSSFGKLTYKKLVEFMKDLFGNVNVPMYGPRNMEKMNPNFIDEVYGPDKVYKPGDEIRVRGLEGEIIFFEERKPIDEELSKNITRELISTRISAHRLFSEYTQEAQIYMYEKRQENKGKIRCKKDMYEVYDSGELGNVLPYYKSITEAVSSQKAYPWKISLRYSVSNARSLGLPWYSTQIDPPMASLVRRRWIKEFKCDPDKILVFIPPDDSRVILQGEITQHPVTGYGLTYTTKKHQMLPAMKEEMLYKTGPGALLILRSIMDEQSYENVHRLFSIYEYATIEFSTFSYRQGTLGWNTLFWEIRHY